MKSRINLLSLSRPQAESRLRVWCQLFLYPGTGTSGGDFRNIFFKSYITYNYSESTSFVLVTGNEGRTQRSMVGIISYFSCERNWELMNEQRMKYVCEKAETNQRLEASFFVSGII